MSKITRFFSRVFGRGSSGRGKGNRPSVRGGYDAARTTSENQNHWAAADSYSANASNDASTRQILRDRSRYEEINNGYYSGLSESIANDVVGTGPRPQLQIPDDPGRKLARFLERRFARWAMAADFSQDLRIMQRGTITAGETFAIITNNPAISRDGRNLVELDLQVYEAEQCADPWDFGLDPLYTDGIEFDAIGNPKSYKFLKNHPGGVAPFRTWETEQFSADWVLHWHKPFRPGQHRGIPWLTAALPLFAQLRRYTLATLSAAELAAMLAGVMKTDILPDTGATPTVESFESIDLIRGALLTLPQGWDASQFEPKQPVSTYKDFKGEILNEIARPGQAPFNIIAGNSSGYNYSSGRLDHLIYHRSIGIERHRMEQRILSRVFWLWLKEAVLVYGLSRKAAPIVEWEWSWFWDGFQSIDPQKDAVADEKNLKNGTTTLAEICAADGRDWEDVVRQRDAELRLQEELAAARKPAKPSRPSVPANGANGTNGDAAHLNGRLFQCQ